MSRKSSIIELPQWINCSPETGCQWNAEAAREANTGLNFWVYVTTVPLTLLTLANLIAAWRAQGVVSHKPMQLSWQNSTLISGDVAAEIKKLKTQAGPELWVHGSGKMSRRVNSNLALLRVKAPPRRRLNGANGWQPRK